MSAEFTTNLSQTSIYRNTSRVYSLHTNDECMFQRTVPTVSILLVYALVVPTLATFGLCTNFINAVVFMRPKMTPSAFTYLAALSWLDCLSCVLIMMTAISRSYFYHTPAWVTYDYQWQTPLFGISTGAANLVLACVSLDRFIYLSQCRVSNGAPRFCRRKVARVMICVVILVSVLVNLPYFFIFVVDHTGVCYVTDFYYSKFYQVHNWFSFTLLALLPAIFLLIGNTSIIIVFRRWTKQSKCFQQSGSNDCGRTSQKRYHHQMKLTVSILIVITLYMVGELPAHMTSRKSSLNLLFSGDVNKVDVAKMERLEVIFITLNALQLSMNIVVYAVINPCFMPEFFLCLRGISDACFRLCCLTAVARSYHRCQNWTKSLKQPNVEEDVISSIAPQPLPADEASQFGCASCSSNSSCDDVAHCKTTAGTFAFEDEYDSRSENATQRVEQQQEIFITKSSDCKALVAQSIDNDSHLSSFVIYP